MHNTTTLARMRFLSMKGKLRAAVPQREVGNGSSKVNEQDIRVKHRRAEEESWNEPGKDFEAGNVKRGYLPCVEATVVRPAFWELLFAVTFDFVVELFVCATLFFCAATAFPFAIFFLLKSFTILATYARVS